MKIKFIKAEIRVQYVKAVQQWANLIFVQSQNLKKSQLDNYFLGLLHKLNLNISQLHN